MTTPIENEILAILMVAEAELATRRKQKEQEEK